MRLKSKRPFESSYIIKYFACVVNNLSCFSLTGYLFVDYNPYVNEKQF